MKMDLKTLCGLLVKTSEKESVSNKDCNPYLLKKVLYTLMQEKRYICGESSASYKNKAYYYAERRFLFL